MPSRLIIISAVAAVMMVSVLVGLFFNIKTVSLSQKISALRSDINELEEDVMTLRVDVLSQNRWEIIERKATEELYLVKPRRIIFFPEKSASTTDEK